MANPSIYAAFERMWQHVTAALGSKASKNVATTAIDGLMSSTDKAKIDSIATGANKITKTSELDNDSGFIDEVTANELIASAITRAMEASY